MILRPASGADAAAVATLERSLFGDDAWSVPSVVAELSGVDRFAAVAVSGGALVGYAITSRTDDVVDLHRIGVHASRRRQGIGRALLTVTLERAAADGADRMLLEVGSQNVTALAFYAREGFLQIDRRPRYYRDGSDALVLGRPLGRPLGDAPGDAPGDGG